MLENVLYKYERMKGLSSLSLEGKFSVEDTCVLCVKEDTCVAVCSSHSDTQSLLLRMAVYTYDVWRAGHLRYFLWLFFN